MIHPRWFPYMDFARSAALGARWTLTQSGMPAAPVEVLGGRPLADLSHPAEHAAPALRRRLAELLGADERLLLLALGASGGMHLAAEAFFGPGTRVLVETPSYDPLRALPERMGAEVRLLERRASRGWAFDLAEAERLAAGAPGPCHVFATNSHNPTGAVLGAAEVRALAALAARSGGALVCCEVYMEFAAPGERVHAALLAPNAISIGSLTKAYGLGPLRAGWLLLGEGLAAERERLEDLAHLDQVDPPTPALAAALNALDHLPELTARIRAVERDCRPLALRWLARHRDWECAAPRLGITAFPRLAPADAVDAPGAARALARYLREVHEVGVVPGDYFDAPGHLRLGFGLAPAALAEALERLDRGLEGWRALDPAMRASLRPAIAPAAAPRRHPLAPMDAGDAGQAGDAGHDSERATRRC
jgi:aspartate/methionine/tyrosine aminotransferase